jgi:hypothetical protein
MSAPAAIPGSPTTASDRALALQGPGPLQLQHPVTDRSIEAQRPSCFSQRCLLESHNDAVAVVKYLSRITLPRVSWKLCVCSAKGAATGGSAVQGVIPVL